MKPEPKLVPEKRPLTATQLAARLAAATARRMVACLLLLVFIELSHPGTAHARTVYYFNERTHPGLIQSELLYTYQGVVNRSGPRIFIISDLCLKQGVWEVYPGTSQH